MNVRRGALCVVVIALITALDQFTKQLFFAKPDLISGFAFAKGLTQFTDYHNFGITFSLPFPQLWTIGLTILLCAFIIFWGARSLRRGAWMDALALSILLGGAFGNVIDRMVFGFVRDWLLFFGHSAVNLADGAVLVGGVWFLIRQSARNAKLSPPKPLDKT